jgi:predicted HTH domain antitoxin
MSRPAASTQSGTHRVVLSLPEELVRLLGPTPTQAAAHLKKLALIELFRRGEVSSGYAAEMLGISKWDFIDLLARHAVPYVDLSEEELRHDLEVAQSH